ncbi:phospho-sugar mutase [Pseudogracilibacillus sp. SO30301A]|uniref:phospho-sugar mutase n=1 Tax=Pseudogracilibacillus sp. SO30301A TaxID=3098291 RepID=UPI00300DE490
MGKWESVFQSWVESEELEPTARKQLQDLKNNPEEMKDSFYQHITLENGKMQGVLGPGINRMNIYTVRRAIQGLAYYLKENLVNYKDRGIVIAFDSSHMSKEFALESAKVLGVHGIRTYIFESLRPTPLLSFAVRYLRTAAGIMFTASHHQPEYNGFKIYNEEGSQITFEETSHLTNYLQQVKDELQIDVLPEEELIKQNLLHWVKDEVDNAYVKQLITITKMDEKTIKEKKDLKIVFTPLYGTAQSLVEAGLKQLNFANIHVVKEQAVANFDFSTVKSPNLEERQTFEKAIKLGEEVDADILLATDLNAERLGVAVKNKQNEYTILTGNQLGCLLLDYILKHANERVLNNARLLKTIVTTELSRAIATSYHVKTIDTLSGFQNISEKINEFDATGETFIFGFEENCSYLINSFSRDKDAVQAAVMTSEMASFWKAKGKTLLEVLDRLYKKFGYYKEGFDEITLDGVSGQEKMSSIVNIFKSEVEGQIDNLQIEYIEDYLTKKRRYCNNKVELLDFPHENVVKYMLEGNRWVCLHLSETTSKIKWYYAAYGKTAQEADGKFNMIKKSLKETILQPLELVK